MATSCKQCAHYQTCKIPCIYVEIAANGNARTREPIASPDKLQSLPQSDYNQDLYQLMRDRESRDIERLEAIRECRDIRRRAILSMQLAWISQRIVSRLLHIDQGHISRIARGVANNHNIK
jgi:predicted XRE-type DNA-binding protein